MLSRVAVVGLVGGLAAACSSNTARFSENPFSNPFNSGASDQTHAGYAPAQPSYAQPVSQGAYAPVPSVASQPLQPVANVSGGGWTADGGTPIAVGQGDNLNSISNRYGVPTNAILAANGLTSPSQVTPGRNIVIPIYSVNGGVSGTRMTASAPVVARPPAPPQAVARAPASTLNGARQVADAKLAAPQKTAQTALQKPLSQPVAVAKAKSDVAQVQAQAKAVPQKMQPPAAQAATFEVPVKQQVAAVKPVAAAPAQVASAAKDAEQTASLRNPSQPNAEFRWPAKGRVISGFGSGKNEGINISVPEGTPVRAAESGVVTFAGDDVKSYGNLVLIKHDNGYISAYAHNGSLNVKRGDRVNRGQVIAKSGQSGDVTSPQLHFEIRKGQTPVDPASYLGG